MLAELLAGGIRKRMMWDFPYDSPQAIANLLSEYGFALSKKFGQNFLISSTARERIAEILHLQKNEHIWEIGPGIGALTHALLYYDVTVTAFEIDHGFATILRDRACVDEPRFHLVEGDVLKTWESHFAEEGTPDAICGNLPYNVGSICIGRFLESQCHPKRMVFTLQKEVADRLAAQPGTKQWSTLAILAQIDYQVTTAFFIRPGSFFPPPHVDSAVVYMSRLEKPVIRDQLRPLFLQLTSDLFTQRRKTIRNNLLRGTLIQRYPKEVMLNALAQSGISEQERAENLSIEQILALAETLAQHNS
jgi:16S rRNA (adenine1518-N6/adenine1519-N6)-dimethyltransferase